MEETLLAIAGPKKKKEVQDLLAAEIDGEDDFDAADHERRMERLFDDNFYGEDDDESKHPFEGQEMSCAGIDDDGLPLTQSWRPKMGENEFGKCMSQSILKPQRQEVCSARRRRYEQRALGRGGAGGVGVDPYGRVLLFCSGRGTGRCSCPHPAAVAAPARGKREAEAAGPPSPPAYRALLPSPLRALG